MRSAPAARPATSANPRGRHLLVWIVAIVAIVLVLRAFLPHENRYEKIARNVTVALQQNNAAEVRRYQNAETATRVTQAVVGRAADLLGPLGKLKAVKETTPSAVAPREHDFVLTFEHGTVDERMKLDPDDKIVAFHYQKAGP